MGPMAESAIRVLLVDDEPLVRAAVGRVLRAAPESR